MNLRRATFLLIAGLCYTVLHKALHALAPAVTSSRIGAAATSLLWLVATAALVVFALQFLREVRPDGRWLRYSLFSIAVFTTLVIVAKLPVWPVSTMMLAQRPLFAISRLLNSAAILIFLFALYAAGARDSCLRAPLRVAIGACCLTLVFGLGSTGYILAFMALGGELRPWPFLQPLAVVSFVITHGAVVWFLVRFARVQNYSALVRGPSRSAAAPPNQMDEREPE